MKMKNNYYSRLKSVMLLLLCLLASYQFAYAQTTISGKVTDGVTSEPIIGANILVKGTASGTVTDIDGNYQVEVPSGATVLTFSFVGYKTLDIEIGNQTTINVKLATDIKMLDELVVVGYGQMEKKDVTGSMSSMREEDFNQGAMTSPDQLMQGRAAGVVITPSSGEPGGGVNIRIRGGTSLTASNEPLYVIDGFPIDNTASDPGSGSSFAASARKNPLSTLNPADIASIDILKDASATAIYGARGANGVIIITTKKGKEGKANVSYNGLVGSSSIAKKLDVLSASAYRSATNANGSNPLDEGASTDWQDAMTQNGMMQSHNLSVTGGTEKAQYRVSGGYFKQDGIIINSGVERFTVNMNLNQKITDKVSMGFTMQGSHVLDNNLPYGTGGATNGGVINNMLRISPLLPLDWEINDQLNKNPYLMAKHVRDNTKTNRMRASAFIEAQIIDGLTAKFNVGGDLTAAKRTSHLPDRLLWVGTGNGQTELRTTNLSNVLTEATLAYTKEFEAHRINMVAGYTYQKFMKEEFGATASGFALDDVAEHNIQQASTIRATSYKEKSELASWLGRANYSFKDRYVITATVRADGSSRFGANNKWGIFPSASVAWRISEESFMPDSELFTDLKLRAGWGVTGSQEIGNYRSLPIVSGDPGKSVIDASDNIITGIGLTNYANPDLKWEETAQANIGLDFELMRGRIYGTLDYYIKNTSNLLLELSAAQPAPVTTYLANIGEVKNSGLEFLIGSVNFDENGFKWETTFNGATNKNEVVSIGDFEEINAGPVAGRGQTGQFSQIVKKGQPYGSFYGFQYLGIDESGNEQFSETRQIIGNAQPDFTWGMNNIFSYQKFDFSVFLQGSHGAQVFNNTALEFSQLSDLYGAGSTYNVMANALDEGSNSAAFSSRFVEDASFVRLANISLGYKFDMTDVSFIESLRVYATGQNLAIFTNYSGYDPEVSVPAGSGMQVPSMGVDYNNYPRARSYQIGLSVTF